MQTERTWYALEDTDDQRMTMLGMLLDEVEHGPLDVTYWQYVYPGKPYDQLVLCGN